MTTIGKWPGRVAAPTPHDLHLRRMEQNPPDPNEINDLVASLLTRPRPVGFPGNSADVDAWLEHTRKTYVAPAGTDLRLADWLATFIPRPVLHIALSILDSAPGGLPDVLADRLFTGVTAGAATDGEE